ncbi:MAG: hypothetical protein R3E58_12615 [Phycisphaerae bacterium]
MELLVLLIATFFAAGPNVRLMAVVSCCSRQAACARAGGADVVDVVNGEFGLTSARSTATAAPSPLSSGCVMWVASDVAPNPRTGMDGTQALACSELFKHEQACTFAEDEPSRSHGRTGDLHGPDRRSRVLRAFIAANATAPNGVVPQLPIHP